MTPDIQKEIDDTMARIASMPELPTNLLCPACKVLDVTDKFDCMGLPQGYVFCPNCWHEFPVDGQYDFAAEAENDWEWQEE